MFTRSRPQWWVAGLAFTVPLAFAWFANHAWEDYFITLRSSRNLVEGHGLVFNPGQRAHTFTSPLGVLIPALCTWLAGAGGEQVALWIFRVINASLLAAAARLVWHRADTAGLGTPGRWLLFGLILADGKLNDFSTNGMETAILVFFVLWLWCELEAPAGPRVRGVALTIAGLMWTRPDAFVLAGALIVPHLLIRKRTGETLPFRWGAIARGVLLGGLLYLPWFGWAWWYYGSPIPHTIIAKSAFTPRVNIGELLLLPWHELASYKSFPSIDDLFLPSYWFFGGWPFALNIFAHVLTLLAAFAWVVPGGSAIGRRLSLAVFFGMFYLGSIILFPWYLPPWTALSALAIAFAVDRVYARAAASPGSFFAPVIRVAIVVIVFLQVGAFLSVAWQMRAHQRFVETNVRQKIGEWLRQNAAPGDTVFLEPLGYIGYYSQLKTYDFPGLSSPEVVAAIRHGAKNYADLIERLRPTWVVLRPVEAARSEFKNKNVLADYEKVKSWSALADLNSIHFFPGRQWSEFEAEYFLYRRKPGS